MKSLYFINLDNEIAKGKDGHVASVAVQDGTKLLMGKRRDNDKWTLPGGHLESGESKHDGAVRELAEESGIVRDKKDLKHLGSTKLKTFTGQEKTIHAFTVNHDGSNTTMRNDPDQEVYKWHWIETKDGLPEHVKNNLHSPKNIVLKKLKLIKGDSMEFFVVDLLKGAKGQTVAGHMYLRKYRRGDKWIYVYHEAGQHGRVIDEEAIKKIKSLMKLGDEHAKALHDTLEAHNEDKLKKLRTLADLGDGDAHEHLKSLGIDRKAEKLEEDLIPAKVEAQKDDIDKELSTGDRSAAIKVVKDHIAKAKKYLEDGGYAKMTDGVLTGSSDVGKQVYPTLNSPEILATISKAKTTREVLDAMAKIAEKLESAQTSPTSSYGSNYKTYGNKIYNESMNDLVELGRVSIEYAKDHKREARATETKHMSFKEHEKHVSTRVEREAAERAAKAERDRLEAIAREEEDRRTLAEVHGSMAHYMSTISGRPMPATRVKELHQALKRIFGKDLRKEDFPYNFEAQGMKTKITNLSFSGSSVSLDMQVIDADGKEMMNSWQRNFSISDGRPHIYNSYMVVNSGSRGGVQIGNLINQNQRRLMKSLPNGGTVGVTAALDVGAYTWANQGFSFNDDHELNRYRDNFQRFLAEKGINLTREDMMKFKEPVHFAAFTNGKKFEKRIGTAIKLTPQQIETKSLSGVEGENVLSPSEISSGKSDRMLCHLGKLFMLGRSWHGTWDSAEETTASKYADSYYQMRERAVKVLEPEYRAVATAAASGERARSAAPTAVTPRAVATGESDSTLASRRMIQWWTRRPTTPGGAVPAIRMTPQRMERVLRLSTDDLTHFHQNASLSPSARRQIRDVIRTRREQES